MKPLVVLLLGTALSLRPNAHRRTRTAVAAYTKTEAAPILVHSAASSLEKTAVDAQHALSTSSLDATPTNAQEIRAPPTDAVATPPDAKNNVLKLDRAKTKPCAFAPAALELTEQRSYKDETDFPELALKYYADPRIHGWGNVGLNGAVHALMAPTFTAVSPLYAIDAATHALITRRFTAALDAFAYGGLDTRNAAWDRVDLARATVGSPSVETCVDLGTGTGATARSLRKRYQASVIGVDTSREMLRAAKDLTHTGSLDFCTDVTFRRHNAEATGLVGGQADIVSVFFLLHEAPAAARRQILREAFRLLAPGGTLALCDIHPEYDPSPIMLSGEPYLNGYLDNIDVETETSAATHGLRLHREVLVAGRLTLWTFQKAL
jgi:SAM-dependent methyltransferase